MKYMEELLKSKDKKIQTLQNSLDEYVAHVNLKGDEDEPNLSLLSKKDLMDKVSELLQKNAQ